MYIFLNRVKNMRNDPKNEILVTNERETLLLLQFTIGEN